MAHEDVSVAGDSLAPLAVHGFVVRLPGAKSVDVAVEHAKGGGHEDGVVDLEVGCSGGAGVGDVFGSNVLAAFLHLGGYDEQSLQLLRDVGVLEIRFDALDEILVAVEAGGGDVAVAGLAIVAVVEVGDVGGDKLALAGRSECGACSRVSTRSFMGRAVSGRKAIRPRIPGSPSGTLM